MGLQHSVHIWTAETTCRSQFSLSLMCTLGMELRLLSLVAGAFPHWAILLAYCIIILIVHIYEVQHVIQINLFKYGN